MMKSESLAHKTSKERRNSKEFVKNYRQALQTEENLSVMESFSEDFSDSDPYGFAITEALNCSRKFKSFPTTRKENDKEASWGPLLSFANWQRLQESLQEIDVAKIYHYLFWNVKSFSGILCIFGGLLLASIIVGASATVYVTLVYLKLMSVFLKLALKYLIDVNDLKSFKAANYFLKASTSVNKYIQWIDWHMLQGRNYSGREWNTHNDYELQDSKLAQSGSKYLWALPPPSSLPKGSIDTTEHILAIQYCHEMLTMAFLQKSPAKRSRQQPSSKNRFPVLSSHQVQEDTINYTRALNTPKAGLTGLYGNQIEEPPTNLGAIQVKSPTDAIEVFSTKAETKHFFSEGEDMKWSNVGAEIGFKLLGSVAVQKAMTSHDTAEQISNLSKKLGISPSPEELESSTLHTPKTPLAHPVHSMWTSASAATTSGVLSPSVEEVFETRTDEPSKRRSQEEEEEQDYQSSFTNLNADGNVEPKASSITQEGDELSVISIATTNIEQQVPSATAATLIKNDAEEMDGKRTEDSFHSNEKAFLLTPSDGPTSISPTLSSKLPLIPAGVKIVVPLFPIQPHSYRNKKENNPFQMGTVVSSKRIYIGNSFQAKETNCLSVTLKLDKSFLRSGEFAEMTFRVMDSWGHKFVPQHSKLPLGKCVSTAFGVGILVGWRVEDDVHIVQGLWQRRGSGSACAYLNRDAINSTVKAAVGLKVRTSIGKGTVLAIYFSSSDVKEANQRYLVHVTDSASPSFGQAVKLESSQIVSCPSAQFIPVIEHIREAAKYRLQLLDYKESIEASPVTLEDTEVWRNVSKWSDMLWKSFLLAIEEDEEFDEGMNEFLMSMVKLLDKLEGGGKTSVMTDDSYTVESNNDKVVITTTNTGSSSGAPAATDTIDGSNWFMYNAFGMFSAAETFEADNYNQENKEEEIGIYDQFSRTNESIEIELLPEQIYQHNSRRKSYNRIYGVFRTMMRTTSLARAACVDDPDFKLALNISQELLLFVRTVIRVQERNTNPYSIQVWNCALEEIASTFGPAKERLEKIVQGITERMEKQGNRAKVHLLKFVDIIVQDDILLLSIEQGDWGRLFLHLEEAMVKSQIIEQENREHYHKTALFLFDHFASRNSNSEAGARNNAKVEYFARFIQCLASPKRSVLKLFLEVGMLNTIERILVRVFRDEDGAARMLSIYSSNFQSLRQFRMLKDFTISGKKFWQPLLDAADAELTWIVSGMPESTKEYMSPLSKLFSLCVAEFHNISVGDLPKHWLDFLMEEEAVSLIHDIDIQLIRSLESFSRDVKEMLVVLPYYPSIEDDILNLVDQVDFDDFLREASDAIGDADKFSDFIRVKTTIAIERFLEYLPKMSIPVEKRDLGDGWVLTCRGEDGGDLTLTDLVVKRENLVCQVLGGDSLFFPMLSDGADDYDIDSPVKSPKQDKMRKRNSVAKESSILDHIRDMIIQAQHYGCWKVGVGGVKKPAIDRYDASVLQGLPISKVLDCGIELWRNLEIDDDELLEIAIKDVSYQIKINQEDEEDDCSNGTSLKGVQHVIAPSSDECVDAMNTDGNASSCSSNKYVDSIPDLPDRPPSSTESLGQRFNPRVDPTVLYLEIKMLTFHLEKFFFRIEKEENKRTVFDPVFEGCGSLLVRNVSIKLRVECVKGKSEQRGLETQLPIFQLAELDVQLEKVKLKVKDTGVDWLLNKVVRGFEDSITQIVATNLGDQVREQVHLALENLNSYFEVNPDVLLGLLGISMEDLGESVVWV